MQTADISVDAVVQRGLDQVRGELGEQPTFTGQPQIAFTGQPG